MTRAQAVRKTPAPLAAALAAALLAAPAGAATEHLGTYESWGAWKRGGDGPASCYVASNPQTSEGDYTRRGKAYVFVEVREGEGHAGIVSFKAGYRFREESTVDVEVRDQRKFTLYTKDDAAWAYDEDDPALVDAMRKGFTMVVRGVSWRGTKTTDTYDLRGFTAASEAMAEGCSG